MECPSKTFLLFTSVHQVTLAPVCTWSYPRSSRKIQVHFSLYLCGIFSCAAASCYILIIIWGAHDVDAASAAIPISRLTLQFTKIVLQLANIEFSDKTCCCRCACCIHCRQVILRVPFSYESAQQGASEPTSALTCCACSLEQLRFKFLALWACTILGWSSWWSQLRIQEKMPGHMSTSVSSVSDFKIQEKPNCATYHLEKKWRRACFEAVHVLSFIFSFSVHQALLWSSHHPYPTSLTQAQDVWGLLVMLCQMASYSVADSYLLISGCTQIEVQDKIRVKTDLLICSMLPVLPQKLLSNIHCQIQSKFKFFSLSTVSTGRYG